MDRKVIDSETLAVVCKGRIWTGPEIIESVNAWVCPVTGLGLTSPHFASWKHGRQTRQFLVAHLANGVEWYMILNNWIKGQRPDPFTMDRHVLKKEAENYGKFLGWGKAKYNAPTLKILLHSGEDYECRIVDWRKGKRPTKYALEKGLYLKQVEDEGHTFVEFGKQGTNPTIKLLLSNGEPYECRLHDWRMGKRPDGKVGGYCETYFERDPETGDGPGVIYYLKITHATLPTFYKIGITGKDLAAHRWGKRDGEYSIEVLNEHSMSLYNCFRLEQDLIKTFTHHRHTPNPPLRRNGNTECFSIDLLGLDPEIEGDEELAKAA